MAVLINEIKSFLNQISDSEKRFALLGRLFAKSEVVPDKRDLYIKTFTDEKVVNYCNLNLPGTMRTDLITAFFEMLEEFIQNESLTKFEDCKAFQNFQNIKTKIIAEMKANPLRYDGSGGWGEGLGF